MSVLTGRSFKLAIDSWNHLLRSMIDVQVPGNKMDAHNLATLFGPNILHKAKGGAFQVESLERAEERAEVISVVKEMIEHQTDIFEVTV